MKKIVLASILLCFCADGMHRASKNTGIIKKLDLFPVSEMSSSGKTVPVQKIDLKSQNTTANVTKTVEQLHQEREALLERLKCINEKIASYTPANDKKDDTKPQEEDLHFAGIQLGTCPEYPLQDQVNDDDPTVSLSDVKHDEKKENAISQLIASGNLESEKKDDVESLEEESDHFKCPQLHTDPKCKTQSEKLRKDQVNDDNPTVPLSDVKHDEKKENAISQLMASGNPESEKKDDVESLKKVFHIENCTQLWAHPKRNMQDQSEKNASTASPSNKRVVARATKTEPEQLVTLEMLARRGGNYTLAPDSEAEPQIQPNNYGNGSYHDIRNRKFERDPLLDSDSDESFTDPKNDAPRENKA